MHPVLLLGTIWFHIKDNYSALFSWISIDVNTVYLFLCVGQSALFSSSQFRVVERNLFIVNFLILQKQKPVGELMFMFITFVFQCFVMCKKIQFIDKFIPSI
jgi:hypothetical protein